MTTCIAGSLMPSIRRQPQVLQKSSIAIRANAVRDIGAGVFTDVLLDLAPIIISGALFAFLLSWGNFPLSLYTTGADSAVPEYLYAKMVAGYTPGVPVLGTLSTVGAAILLLGFWALLRLMRRGNLPRNEK